MFKQEITYTDFNGNKRTEDHWFHLSKAEITKLNMEYEEGLGTYITDIVKGGSKKDIYNLFVKLIKLSYGIKSPDGKRFIKNDDIYNDFIQSPAYDELLMTLFSDEKLLSSMFTKMFPSDIAAFIGKQRDESVKVVDDANA